MVSVPNLSQLVLVPHPRTGKDRAHPSFRWNVLSKGWGGIADAVMIALTTSFALWMLSAPWPPHKYTSPKDLLWLKIDQ